MAFNTLFDPRFLYMFLAFLLSLGFSSPYAFSQSPMQVAGTATKVASSSGNWTSASTWGGSLPGDDDRVLIPEGITVTVDDKISQEFKSVRIDNGGKLAFATDVDTELRTEYLFSGMMGTIEIGTNSNPIQTDRKASLVFAERGGTSSSFDPDRFAPGAVLMGPTTMQGSEKTSWLTLMTHPKAGSTEFVLDYAPTGWKIGDQLVVAGTDPITNASISSIDEIGSDEVVTITNISNNIITFTPPLVRDHIAPSQAPDLDVHVANLSRNIVISSENPSVSSIGGEFRKPRGHIMFMHNLDVNFKYVEANNLGRTDKSIILDDWDFEDLDANQNTGSPVPNGKRNPRGRYSFHFHRGGLDDSVFPARPITPLPTPAVVEGCVVNNDPGWGYVNHSARVNFIKNVSYDVVGGAFNTEAGNETGSFIENIAIRTINPENPIMTAPRPRDSYTEGGPTGSLVDLREHRQDFAWQGDGFWFHSGGITVEGNVVSGCTGHAYVYWLDGLIEKGMGAARGDIDAHVPASEFPSQNQMLKDWKNRYPNFVLDTWYLQPRPFNNNTAYNFVRGVQTYYMHTEFHQRTDPSETDPNSWMNDLPGDYKDQLQFVFDGTVLWNIGRTGFGHETSTNITIQNSKIFGYGSRTGYEDYGTNPAPDFVQDEPEVIGIDMDYFHNTHRWKLNNNTVEGFSGNSVGIVLPKNAQVTIDGGTFNNSGTDIFVGCASENLSNEDDGFGIGMLSVNPTQSEVLIKGNINFQNSNNNIVMDAEIIYDEVTGKGFPLISGEKVDPLYFFAPQVVTLDFGPFNNTNAYFNEQDASYTPITSGNRCTISNDGEACVKNQYANKTNTQLKNQYNKSFLGTITPSSAVTHPIVIGGKVGEVSSDPCEGAVPMPPSSFSAQNNNCTSIQLSWSSVQCANSYLIQKRIDSGSWYTLNSSVTGTSYTDNNSSTGILQYRLRAQNANGHSAYVLSNSINCSDNPPTQYTLSVSTVGNGAVSLNPAGGSYDEGTVVTLTASPNSDSQFDNWSGDLTGSNNPITISMNSDKNVVANFSLIDMGDECEWVTIDFNDFESGWGIWNDGGSDCRRSARDEDYSSSGRYSVRLRDNTNSSVMTTDILNLSDYEEIAIEFNYFARSMDNANEDFWLQISTNGGDDFTTIEEWNKGDEFDNDEFYTDVVNISSMSFSDNTVIRFRCDASGNSDWVYIDDVKISGCTKMKDDDGEPEFQDIINFSFEEPGEGDFEDDFSRIPGWNKGGDGDSGIEKGWMETTDGEWMCYHEAGDNYIHQTLELLIESGKSYTVQFDAINMEDEEAKAQILLRYGSVNIVNKIFSLTDDWDNYTVSFNSDDFPSAIGQNLKIFFRNKGEEGSYAGFDNFILSIGQEFTEESNDRSLETGQIISNRSVVVYPNPVIQGNIVRLNTSGFDDSAWYSVYHINGKIIHQGPLHRVSQISTTGLQSGIYILRVSDEHGAKTSKFIVQNI